MVKRFLLWAIFLGLSAFPLLGQHQGQSETFVRLADDFRKNQQIDSAIVYYEKAALEFQTLGHIEKCMDAYNQTGILLTRQDKYDAARQFLEKALTIGQALPDSNNLVLSTTYISLGVVYNALTAYNRALAYHQQSLSIRLALLGPNDAQVATCYGNIGNVHRNNKDFDLSIEAHEKAMQIRERVFGASSPEIVESYVGLGRAYKEKKAYETALEYFHKALNNKVIQYGEGHKDVSRFYNYISEVYYLMENKEQGDWYKSKAEGISKKQ